MLMCILNIDACASHPCQNEGTCNDEVNQYSCICKDGYTHANCQTGMCNSNIAEIDIAYICKTAAYALGNPKVNCQTCLQNGRNCKGKFKNTRMELPF